MSEVTLSFDNGPDAQITGRILDLLARRELKASFFVLGSRLEDPAARGLAAPAAAEGHWIGNHSWSHKIPLGEDRRPDAVEREIAATERALGSLADSRKLFRPFGGGGKIGPHLLSPAARDYLVANHHTCVLWNCVPEDWIDQEGWVPRALDQCARSPRALVVLHDILPIAMRHLDTFIGALLDAGHRIVQDYPPECIPIDRGIVTGDLSGIVADDS
jgi:peptidoglycan/xylan/chitin deacetylase (PgdA/CDA1 family)